MPPNRIVPWGLRQAVIVDPEARRWEILRQLADVPPAAWGAVQSGPHTRMTVHAPVRPAPDRTPHAGDRSESDVVDPSRALT